MDRNTRRMMAGLGYAGLIPFYAFAFAAWLPDSSFRALSGKAFIVYAVVILAFLGGTLWGNAVGMPWQRKRWRLLLSNIVALFAAVAGVLAQLVLAAALLAFGQLALLAYERSTAAAAGWYIQLRTRLTLGVMPAFALFISGWALRG